MFHVLTKLINSKTATGNASTDKSSRGGYHEKADPIYDVHGCDPQFGFQTLRA